MMNKTLIIPTIGRYLTPLAMVVFMAYEITQSQPVTGWWVWAVGVGAVGSAVGVEAVGIMAGDVLEAEWRLGNVNRASVAGVMLLLYVAVAMFILRHNPTLMPVPFIASLVYILSAMSHGTNDTVAEKKEDKQDTRLYNRRQKEIANERKHLQAMATISNQAQPAQVAPQPEAQPSATPDNLTGNALEVYKLLTNGEGLSQAEIGSRVGVSRQMVGKYKKQFNGYIKS